MQMTSTNNNIISYLNWRGDIPSSVVPFGEVDLLVLAVLIYGRLEDVEDPIGKTVREIQPFLYPKKERGDYNTYEQERKELWRIAATTERFGSLKLDYFTNDFSPETEEQFAAGVFLDQEDAYLVYRGTDGTVTGWKEDFNMAFEDEVPSQRDSVRLLEALAPRYKSLSITGHSKGGFLAVWSAFGAKEESFRKVDRIWSFDGPGLQSKYINTSRWEPLSKKVSSYVPESSVIGMIYTAMVNPAIVKSRSVGIYQHDPFCWQIQGSKFLRNEDTTLSSKLKDMTIKAFFEECTAEERKTLVNTVYSIIEICGEEETSFLPEASVKNLPRIIEAMKQIPEENRKLIWDMVTIFGKSGMTSIKKLWNKEV